MAAVLQKWENVNKQVKGDFKGHSDERRTALDDKLDMLGEVEELEKRGAVKSDVYENLCMTLIDTNIVDQEVYSVTLSRDTHIQLLPYDQNEFGAIVGLIDSDAVTEGHLIYAVNGSEMIYESFEAITDAVIAAASGLDGCNTGYSTYEMSFLRADLFRVYLHSQRVKLKQSKMGGTGADFASRIDVNLRQGIVRKQGALLKQGNSSRGRTNNTNKWKRRLVLLKSSPKELLYCEDNGNIKGSVRLLADECLVRSTVDSSFLGKDHTLDHIFELHVSGKKKQVIRFEADSVQEKEDWVEAIAEVLNKSATYKGIAASDPLDPMHYGYGPSQQRDATRDTYVLSDMRESQMSMGDTSARDELFRFMARTKKYLDMLDQGTEVDVVTEEMEKEGMNQTEIQFFLKACNLGPGVTRKSQDRVEPPPDLEDDDGEQLQPISVLEDTEEVSTGTDSNTDHPEPPTDPEPPTSSDSNVDPSVSMDEKISGPDGERELVDLDDVTPTPEASTAEGTGLSRAASLPAMAVRTERSSSDSRMVSIREDGDGEEYDSSSDEDESDDEETDDDDDDKEEPAAANKPANNAAASSSTASQEVKSHDLKKVHHLLHPFLPSLPTSWVALSQSLSPPP